MNLDELAAALAKPPAPEIPAALVAACEGQGVTPAQAWQALGSDRAAVASGEVSPQALQGFAAALAVTLARRSGQRPAHYTRPAVCVHCGPVWLWADAPEQVQGCPWCEVDQSKIPRPE